MCRCWTAGCWSSRCGQAAMSITTLWSTEGVCRSCYSAVRLHVKQLGKRLPLRPCLIGKTSSFPAESSLTYNPDYCLTWRLSHYLSHVSLSPSSHPPPPFSAPPCQDCPFIYLRGKDSKLRKGIHFIPQCSIPCVAKTMGAGYFFSMNLQATDVFPFLWDFWETNPRIKGRVWHFEQNAQLLSCHDQ